MSKHITRIQVSTESDSNINTEVERTQRQTVTVRFGCHFTLSEMDAEDARILGEALLAAAGTPTD